MPALLDAAGRTLRRTRMRLKSLGYSGLRRERWQHPQRVLDALRLEAGHRVADVGSGGGYFTLRLARAVGSDGTVYAVDPDPDMVSLVTERAHREGWDNIVAVEAPEDDPALPEAVDLALVVNALHHLPDPAQYARKLSRYVREDGRVAVIEALPRWFLFGHATEPERIRSLMAGAGYVIDEEHDFLPKQSFLVFRRAA